MSLRAICLCLLSLPLLSIGMIGGDEKPAADKVPRVGVRQPVVREVSDQEAFTGRLEPVATVDLRPRITGTLDKVAFKAGTHVKRGDVLFEIDPRLYQAELKKAEAEVRRAEARLRRLTGDLERAKQLLPRRAIAREDFDRLKEDQAEAAAVVEVVRAALEIARLHLAATKVRAPIDGRIGRPLITAGNLVQADTTTLATLVSVDPIYSAFGIDEKTALRLARLEREGKVPGGKGAAWPVLMGTAGEKDFPHRGKIAFMDNRVNPATGTLAAHAVCANSEGTLLPGMFARIRLVTSAPYKALLIEEQAIQKDVAVESPWVFIVNDKNVVERLRVKLGMTADGLRVVKEGLTAKDRVIVRGLNEVRVGMKVKPEKEPRPEDK
jgi:RND family efflux transporter MFP subunit